MALYLILGAGGLIMLIYYARSKHPVRSALKGMASGGAALMLLHLFGGAFSLPLSIFNLAWSLILGIPGTALMLLLKLVIT